MAQRLDGADLEPQVPQLRLVGEDVVFEVDDFLLQVEDARCCCLGAVDEEGVEVLGVLGIGRGSVRMGGLTSDSSFRDCSFLTTWASSTLSFSASRAMRSAMSAWACAACLAASRASLVAAASSGFEWVGEMESSEYLNEVSHGRGLARSRMS